MLIGQNQTVENSPGQAYNLGGNYFLKEVLYGRLELNCHQPNRRTEKFSPKE